VFVNNLQTTDAFKCNIRTEIRRIPHEMLDRVITNFNVRVATVIHPQGVWIENTINKLSCARKMCKREKSTIHKTYMSVRQVYKKYCEVFLSIQNAT